MTLDCATITVGLLPRKSETPVGAGWLLEDGRILTCEHVIKSIDRGYSIGSEFRVRRHGAALEETHAYRLERVEPLRRDTAGIRIFDDLALLAPVDANASLKGALVKQSDPAGGQTIRAVGYPARERMGTDGAGVIGAVHTNERLLVIQAPIENQRLEGGFSGAPVASNDAIVGLFASADPVAGRGYIITLKTINDWLKTAWLPPPLAQYRAVLATLYQKSKEPAAWFDVRARLMTSGTRHVQSAAYLPDDLAPREFASIAIRQRRTIMLQGDGGSGKSNYLLKVAQILEESDLNYIWLDLKKLTANKDRLGVALSDKDSAWIFEQSYVDKWEKDPRGWVILADGLNEVGDKAQQLLDILDAYARLVKSTLIVTERASAPISPTQKNFERFGVSPLPVELIRDEVSRRRTDNPELSEDMLKVLASPQLLLMYTMGDGTGPTTRPGLFEQHFGRYDLTDRLDALSLLGDRLLRDGGALSFQADVWKEELKLSFLHKSPTLKQSVAATKARALLRQLERVGLVLRKDQDMLEFQHSLFIEWLAARWLIQQPENAWTNAAFTALSIQNSSDDGLKLAVEMLSDPKERTKLEAFLNKMYDWNWQRVLSIIADPKLDMTVVFRDAIIGLNALRFFDRFSHTRDATSRDLDDYLSGDGPFCVFMKDARASAANEAGMMAKLLEHFGKREAPAMPQWQDLIRIALDTTVSANAASLVLHLTSVDPFMAWSASNFMRASAPTSSMIDQVIAAYHASASTARATPHPAAESARSLMELGVGLRWRLVHAISCNPPEERADTVIDFMLEVWRNAEEHRDVRFGAGRCLIELSFDVKARPPGKNGPDISRRVDIFHNVRAEMEHWRSNPIAESDWRRDTRQACKQFWRATQLATTDGIEDVAGWRSEMTKVVELAVELAPVLGWDKIEEIKDGLKQLRKDTAEPDKTESDETETKALQPADNKPG